MSTPVDAASWTRMMTVLTDSLAPYKVVKRGNKYLVLNNAGQTKGTHPTRAQAIQQLRALYVNVKGAPGKADRTKWTGKEPAPKGK